jgi:hypothetical protein
MVGHGVVGLVCVVLSILDSIDFRAGDGPGRAVASSEVAPREGTVEHRGVLRATAAVDLVDRPDENPQPRTRDHDPPHIGVEILEPSRGGVVVAFGDVAAHATRWAHRERRRRSRTSPWSPRRSSGVRRRRMKAITQSMPAKQEHARANSPRFRFIGKEKCGVTDGPSPQRKRTATSGPGPPFRAMAIARVGRSAVLIRRARA